MGPLGALSLTSLSVSVQDRCGGIFSHDFPFTVSFSTVGPGDSCEECSFPFIAPVALRCPHQVEDDIRDRLGGDAKAQGSGS